MKTKTDYISDFRGAIASITLLEMADTFREMKRGQLLEICVRDPETIADIFKILPASTYELIEMKEEEKDYRIKIRKQFKKVVE